MQHILCIVTMLTDRWYVYFPVFWDNSSKTFKFIDLIRWGSSVNGISSLSQYNGDAIVLSDY